jgi:hypothetical protein
LLMILLYMLSVLFAGTVLSPRLPPNPGQERPGLVADWKQRLRSADALLKEGEWRRGARIADSVLSEMRQRITAGEGTAPLLAAGLLYRALGQAGSGDLHSARWDFAIAQIFYPAYSRVALEPYGPAGEALDGWRTNGLTPVAIELGATSHAPDVVPPRRIAGDDISYPVGKVSACVNGPLVVRAIINEQGLPEFPFVAPDVDPILALAALDGMKEWRFEPARQEGRPIRSTYVLTVNFKLPQCPSQP